jgi:hypothetical protein
VQTHKLGPDTATTINAQALARHGLSFNSNPLQIIQFLSASLPILTRQAHTTNKHCAAILLPCRSPLLATLSQVQASQASSTQHSRQQQQQPSPSCTCAHPTPTSSAPSAAHCHHQQALSASWLCHEWRCHCSMCPHRLWPHQSSRSCHWACQGSRSKVGEAGCTLVFVQSMHIT